MMINKYTKIIQEIKKKPYKIWSVFEYITIYKKIRNIKKTVQFANSNTVNIAILTDFTISGLKECLDIQCRIENLKPEINEAPYKQFEQEILNTKSAFYRQDPAITFFLLDPKEIFKEINHSFFSISEKKILEFEKNTISHLVNLINKIAQNSHTTVVFANFITPSETTLGILENKKSQSLSKLIKKINYDLEKFYFENKRVFIFDLDNFAAKYGKNQVVNPKYYYLGHYLISPDFIPQLAYSLMGYIKAQKGKTRKCLVLDLDNVLWGGIVGEDGFAGIQLGPEAPGNVYWELQKTIKSYLDRGIILAINSNNNLKEALEVIQKHPYMILRNEYFSAVKINWMDKVSNMKEIAKDLNINLESLVYLDDDPKKRKMIRDLLPDVKVVELSEDPAYYVDDLLTLNDFNVLQTTEEDLQRGKMYQEQRQRTNFKASVTNLSQFLIDLRVEIHFVQVNSFTIPRLSQLTQRTNQFNLTTKRYSENDIKNFAENNKYSIYAAQIKDKFGDYGICGLAIVKNKKTHRFIDTFLLSCRVLGLDVERALLWQIVTDTSTQDYTTIIGEFIPTSKNQPAANFFQNNQFSSFGKINDVSHWKLDLSKIKIRKPNHIKITFDR